mgnify:CR=1 FL=1
MITDQAKKAVELSRLAANELEYQEFMKRRHNRLKYYNAETEKLTKKWFSANLLKNVPIGNINITKRVIDRTSEVYMIEALRFFDSEPATEKYNEKIPKKHERMQRIERMTNLLDVVLIHPFWNEHKAMMDHSIILEFQPFFDLHGDLVGVKYPLRQSANTSSLDEQTFVEWDLNGWRIVNANGISNKAEEYPGVFPFVLSWTEEPEYFYAHNPTADLVEGNLGINYFQTLLNGNIGFQSFGQPYVTGLQADDKVEWDTSKMLALPDGATAGVLSPPDTVAGVVQAQNNLYKLVARNYHLSEDFVEGQVQATSGVALKVRGQELQNERVGDVVRYKGLEADIFAIERDIFSRVGIALPDKLMVDFSESVEYLSPQEQRERDDWDLSHNLTTVAKIAMRQNKDLDEAQAEQLILDNATSGVTIKKVTDGRSNIVDDILGTNDGGLL